MSNELSPEEQKASTKRALGSCFLLAGIAVVGHVVSIKTDPATGIQQIVNPDALGIADICIFMSGISLSAALKLQL